MRTFIPSAKSAHSRWHVIDAQGQVLGRVSTLAAKLLQGKHKATYTPFIDTGDHVVIINAAQVKLTGRKEDQKIYRRHSGYEGGLREERAAVFSSLPGGAPLAVARDRGHPAASAPAGSRRRRASPPAGRASAARNPRCRSAG